MAQQAILPESQIGAGQLTKPILFAAPTSSKSSIWRRIFGRSSTSASEPSKTGRKAPPFQARPRTGAPVLATAPAPALSSNRQGTDGASSLLTNTNSAIRGDSSAIAKTSSGASRRPVREVVPRLPRTQTFARQQSELRQNLVPVLPTHAERRAVSADRRLASNVSSVPSPGSAQHLPNPRASAPTLSHSQQTSSLGVTTADARILPEAAQPDQTTPTGGHAFVRELPAQETSANKPEDAQAIRERAGITDGTSSTPAAAGTAVATVAAVDHRDPSPERRSLSGSTPGFEELSDHMDTAALTSQQYEQKIHDELEHIWILNLSMHFRDKSRREKFFVTYRQHPDLARRVTISLDYRNAPENSLERDLSETKLPRDKNEMIYEAIRESLADIQFYDTVTNLKLQTTDGRLHVHVVEDVSEIIHYPSRHIVQHLSCHKVREQDVEFDSHMSGFVYKVIVNGQKFIKKEIPGPDSVDEFLYEINALNFLRNSRSVIELYGVIVSDDDLVKGLLISYAEQGALIDTIYDSDHGLSWPTRMKWARQIVRGLSEIHEAGFVQGDFTLSNIVIDNDGNAKIIDINRRGCPVGWEPPEATPLIQSGQQINMYIGVKSDLYQLGMVLWALATQYDNPEAHGRPLILGSDVDVPEWYRVVVETCLAEDPRVRAQARQLLSCFPAPIEAFDHLKDSDEDEDEWLEKASDPNLYAHSVPSGSLDDDDSTSSKYLAGIEGHALRSSSNRDDVDSDRLSHHDNDLSVSSDDDLVPHIKPLATPHNEWSYVELGGDHTFVDSPTENPNETFYYPTRGRSPPSRSRRSASWTRTSGPSNDRVTYGGSQGEGDDERKSFPDTLGVVVDDRVEEAAVEKAANGEQPPIEPATQPNATVTKALQRCTSENKNDDVCSKTAAKDSMNASENLGFRDIRKEEQEHGEPAGCPLHLGSKVQLVDEATDAMLADGALEQEIDGAVSQAPAVKQAKAVDPVCKEGCPDSLDLSNGKKALLI